MSTESFEILTSIVHSEWDDALGGGFPLQTKHDTIASAVLKFRSYLETLIPEDKACTLFMGWRPENDEGEGDDHG